MMEFPLHPALYFLSCFGVAYSVLKLFCDGFNQISYILLYGLSLHTNEDPPFDPAEVSPQSPSEYLYGLLGFVYIMFTLLTQTSPFGI